MIRWILFIIMLHVTQLKAQLPGSIFGQTLPAKTYWVDSVYNKLTLDDKIAQLYMQPLYAHPDSVASYEKFKELVLKYKIGGVIFMKGQPTTALKWLNEFNAGSSIPLLTSIDGEWGLSMRLSNTTRFPKQLTLGAIQNNNLIVEMGREIGRQCKLTGIHINFAPVVDINTNPNNPVINDRSFGERKDFVAKKGMAYALGLMDSKVMPCAKHFPGHGDTDKDSHKSLPTISKSKDQLIHKELYPFRYLFANGVPSCMVGHIYMPQQDKTPNTAASISKIITTDILKNELGFKGMVFTDALNMKGVSAYFQPGEVDLRAFEAGADVLLFSENAANGISIIKKNIEEGSIPDSLLEQKVKKVLGLKYDLGLTQTEMYDTTDLIKKINSKESKLLRKKLYEEAITLVSNKNNLLPFKSVAKYRFASIAVNVDSVIEFQKALSQYIPVTNYHLSKEDTNIQEVFKNFANYNKIIVYLGNFSTQPANYYGLQKKHIELIQKLSFTIDLILCIGGNPYVLKYFQNQDWTVMGYEDNDLTQRAMAEAIMGALPFKGKLPVSAGKIKAGVGIVTTHAFRPRMIIPEEARINANDISMLDSMCLEMIDHRVTPGCQLLVAKDGQIIYNKSFGYHTYINEEKVENTDLYDIASITKIVSTTMATIKLVQEKKLDLYAPVSQYLTLDDSATIGRILVKDLLLHQAGLTPFIPFYQRIKPENYSSYLSNEPVPDYIKVADNLYIIPTFRDSMWFEMTHAKVDSQPRYKYSDVGMYIMQRIIEQITGQALNVYVGKNFFKPMGLKACYNPRNFYDKSNMVPTEDDLVFRKQLLQGYVHDPGAAMYGGVAGHAGVFSNATDIAAIMQMLLNKGNYGGENYLDSNLIDLFTSYRSEISRRGYGFDKPAKDYGEDSPCSRKASNKTFGHTGFTGTCVWVDPAEQLIYVLLTNRIHPTVENKKLIYENWRTRIMDKIYDIIREKGD